ncbi:succinate dehydrogenase / fumarate reductase cytochrome b subunit [Phenylobacterium haematophilum]|uniref:Succinate dehydrogenase cytochrome b556 subunit n=1 Tax=Phenylobacterium haematophilum TaxID=98513 RepID=A0A839ZWT2_9CAUL|nr:succinate dehydrogenase, cytochrome b556 subunit [Phenylobacterium haematophilum]MBB3890786.1 succinate dehydrogenase / fumarate reductase cytochrome b subunit [Phenylobacterium haematophilum]
MSDAPRPRPLSPHLMTGGLGSPLLWRWHITMATSIFHRASIFGLYLSALLLAGWLLALAGGPQSYDAYTGVLGSPLGLLVLFALSFMLFFNLAYNVRQAFWDMGKGFKIPEANAGSIAIIAFAVATTLAFWAVLFILGVL